MRIHKLLPFKTFTNFSRALMVVALGGFGLLSTGVAQDYIVHSEGVSGEFMPRLDGNEILGGSLGSFNEQMTAPQTIPFTFNYYGQNVTQYRASDNGYISFDVSNTTSVGINTTLPNASSPTNAIFGYWDDFELNTTPGQGTVDVMQNYTEGDPGNRVHVITWNSVSRVGLPSGQNFFWFAIRLYETGGFDIIHQWTRRQAAGLISATIGCQDATGAAGVQFTGSPAIDLEDLDPEAPLVRVYSFRSGTQPTEDAFMSGFSMPLVATLNSNHQITGKVFNHGSADITNITIDYNVNGGSPAQYTPTLPAPIKPNEKYEFTHSVPYNANTVGQYADFKVWASAINSGVDANPDSVADDMYVNNGTNASFKKLIFEEFASAPCGFCPDGALVIETMKNTYGDQIVYAQHHAPIGTDAMTIPEHQAYASEFTSGAPTAMIDRTLFQGENNVAFSRSLWVNRAGTQLFAVTPMTMNVETYFDAGTRLITADVTMNWEDYTRTRGLNLTVFVVEDSVTGVGAGYDQINYYSSQSNAAGGPNHPYYNQPDPIPGYYHQDVVRAVLSDTWGDPIVADGMMGGSYTMQYTYTVPATYDLDQIKVAAFAHFNYADDTERYALNANEQRLQQRGVGINDLIADGFRAGVYPNPVQDQATVSFELGEQADLNIEVLDVLGKPVSMLAKQTYVAGEHEIKMETSDLASGLYFVRFTTDKGVYTHKFAISR